MSQACPCVNNSHSSEGEGEADGEGEGSSIIDFVARNPSRVASPTVRKELEEEDTLSQDSIFVFPFQVGGHHIMSRHPTRTECIIKMIFPKEVRFYEAVQQNEYAHLRSIIPEYFGVYTAASPSLAAPSKYPSFVILEDLTFGMEEPCILDIKIGRRLYSDDVCEEKKKRMIKKAKESTSSTLGFRISGFRMVDPDTVDTPGVNEQMLIRVKNQVKGFTKSDVLRTLRDFFEAVTPVEVRLSLVERFLDKLLTISHLVRRTPGRLYSSSLLMVYDRWNPLGLWHCRVIDFVHCHLGEPLPPNEPAHDENFIDGINSLANHLQEIFFS